VIGEVIQERRPARSCRSDPIREKMSPRKVPPGQSRRGRVSSALRWITGPFGPFGVYDGDFDSPSAGAESRRADASARSTQAAARFASPPLGRLAHWGCPAFPNWKAGARNVGESAEPGGGRLVTTSPFAYLPIGCNADFRITPRVRTHDHGR
jgi:hypothetical protein